MAYHQSNGGAEYKRLMKRLRDCASTFHGMAKSSKKQGYVPLLMVNGDSPA
jgi:hypothetical protein